MKKLNIFIYIFLFLIWNNISFSEDLNKIDIRKSFIHIMELDNTSAWRTNIESVLISKNKNIFLLKECRSETISQRPFFDHQGRYEVFVIVENDNIYFVRTSATDGNDGNIQLTPSIKNKKYIAESNANLLSFDEVYEILLSGKTINIYCNIEYEHEEIKYNLITKCEYINYGFDKNNNKYLQPIMGYVPFVDKNKIKYGYVAINKNKRNDGYLEFLLNEKTSIFDVNPNQNLLKLYTKKFLNKLLFFYNKNDFTELVTIKQSKIKFFSYN